LSPELSSGKIRHLSEVYALEVIGELVAPKLLGILTPAFPYGNE